MAPIGSPCADQGVCAGVAAAEEVHLQPGLRAGVLVDRSTLGRQHPRPPHLATSEGDGEGGMDTGMLMAGMGITDGRLPERAAPIHHLLEAASPDVREQLLVLFIGELFT
jgi:hypothetical protein